MVGANHHSLLCYILLKTIADAGGDVKQVGHDIINVALFLFFSCNNARERIFDKGTD